MKVYSFSRKFAVLVKAVLLWLANTPSIRSTSSGQETWRSISFSVLFFAFVIQSQAQTLQTPTLATEIKLTSQSSWQNISQLQSQGLTVAYKTTNVSQTNLASGIITDLRIRNSSGQDYNYSGVRVRISRSQIGDIGANKSTPVFIEDKEVQLPASVRQFWTAQGDTPTGAMYGLGYEIKSSGQNIKALASSIDASKWGGRTSGVVRSQNKIYALSYFWQRQPRKIEVTNEEVIFTLYNGEEFGSNELIRAGEEIWDSVATLDIDASITNSNSQLQSSSLQCLISNSSSSPVFEDCPIQRLIERTPSLSTSERTKLMERFVIAPQGLQGRDKKADDLLRWYDRWNGTSWDKIYADVNTARSGFLGDAPSEQTTLFSLLKRGSTFPQTNPGNFGFRDFGDIPWAGESSNLHYDWVRSALKHYLRTGNEQALRFGIVAARHLSSTDHIWVSAATPASSSGQQEAGLTRYEKGKHGAGTPAKPSHVWVEGLYLASAITKDSWLLETANDIAEAFYRMNLSYSCGEVRWQGWPLLAEVTAFRETGDIRYWQRAKEIMEQLYTEEQASGGAGYFTHRCGFGNINNAQALMSGYITKPIFAFYEVAKQRNEWDEKYTELVKRMGGWVSTLQTQGGAYKTSESGKAGGYAYFFCPIGQSCTQKTEGVEAYNSLFTDLFAWLAQNDNKGVNLKTGESWETILRQIFKDAYTIDPQTNGVVGYLTDSYPGTETKILGWLQLFGDRAAMYLANLALPPIEFIPPPRTTPTPFDNGSSNATDSELINSKRLYVINDNVISKRRIKVKESPSSSSKTKVAGIIERSVKAKITEVVNIQTRSGKTVNKWFKVSFDNGVSGYVTVGSVARIKLDRPIFKTAGGRYTGSVNVEIAPPATMTDASIFYKIRYSSRALNTDSTAQFKKYTGAIELKSSATVYAVAGKAGYTVGRQVSRRFTVR